MERQYIKVYINILQLQRIGQDQSDVDTRRQWQYTIHLYRYCTAVMVPPIYTHRHAARQSLLFEDVLLCVYTRDDEMMPWPDYNIHIVRA